MNRKAFIAWELIIMFGLIVVLMALAIPRFQQIIFKSKEAQTKVNLNQIREAVIVYYGTNGGKYPEDNLFSLMPKYLSNIPEANISKHEKPSNKVHTGNGETYIDGTGGWAYINDKQDPNWGKVSVNCTHKDTEGSFWNSY
ncbi:MAG: type II secretion system protein [Elusimicrobiaceae bacterium]|jgi:type II secretory pathway pseudopilin PulG|nr:type II secretion system protein [Elusimicrobiaceae bacterium]MBT3955315.1 type II secretion system protein [Elusimicrobiaceae bacterium]MBT4008451.1 type II secretion system protein [Elusimicrobiaceae bacterium]MBT4403260.1 type II secretion system protein [Elusimicrobiaceae bacterium]MBT4440180.1 type II secretion system protein [Elusimicrobiaceae bacterium]